MAASARPEWLHETVWAQVQAQAQARQHSQRVSDELPRTRSWQTSWRARLGTADEGPIELTFEELHTACGGFGDKLGEGGSGIVYLATFAPTASGCAYSGLRGKKCAVKVIREHDTDAGELYNEIHLLRLCQHPNLLALVGYTLDPRAPGLVYPLMAGSLEDFIGLREDDTSTAEGRGGTSLGVVASGSVASGDVAEASGAAANADLHSCPLLQRLQPLGGRERLSALTDAARGLHFLHSPIGAKGVVLHRDVKPSNILLDERLQGKLSDFGLGMQAPALAAGHTHLSSHHIIGTFGYIDPLYSDSGHYDQRTDGYALGVSMLVALTGQEAREAKAIAGTVLDSPSRAATVADPAADWDEAAAIALMQEVRGLCWERLAKDRVPLGEVLPRLEALCAAYPSSLVRAASAPSQQAGGRSSVDPVPETNCERGAESNEEERGRSLTPATEAATAAMDDPFAPPAWPSVGLRGYESASSRSEGAFV